MRTILIRLAELLGTSFLLSPITCALYYYAIIPTTHSSYAIVLFIAMVLFIVINIFMLRNCYFDLRNPLLYYTFNYISYAIFMGITVLSRTVFGATPYAWLFNAFNMFAFSEFELTALQSTFVTHAIMLIVIAVAPIGMRWIFDLPEEDEIIDLEEKYKVPSEDTNNQTE